MVDFLSITLFPLLMIVAGAGDALALRIPNWLTALIAAAFLPMALITGMPLASLGLHLAIGAAMFAAGFVLFSLGLFGGGDAKLLAAASLWMGWPDLMPFLVMTLLAGGVLGVAVAVWSFLHMNSEIKQGTLFKHFGSIKPDVPYGFAFAVGAIVAFPQSWWMQVAV